MSSEARKENFYENKVSNTSLIQFQGSKSDSIQIEIRRKHFSLIREIQHNLVFDFQNDILHQVFK